MHNIAGALDTNITYPMHWNMQRLWPRFWNWKRQTIYYSRPPFARRKRHYFLRIILLPQFSRFIGILYNSGALVQFYSMGVLSQPYLRKSWITNNNENKVFIITGTKDHHQAKRFINKTCRKRVDRPISYCTYYGKLLFCIEMKIKCFSRLRMKLIRTYFKSKLVLVYLNLVL